MRIFLSHAQADRPLASRVRNWLGRVPDSEIYSEDSISAGKSWEADLRKALTRSDVFVTILTPRSLDSKWRMAELGAAWGLGKPMFAVTERGPSSLPPGLPKIPLVTVEELESEDSLNQLLARLEGRGGTRPATPKG